MTSEEKRLLIIRTAAAVMLCFIMIYIRLAERSWLENDLADGILRLFGQGVS